MKMRLAKRAVTDADELRGIVEACRTVRIGAADGEGIFIVPMSFGYEWDAGAGAPRLTLWLHSAGEGRKAAAFGTRGTEGVTVAVEMDCEDGVITGGYSCSYSFAYRSIMGSGTVRPVSEPAEKLRGLSLIMDHMAPGAPASFSDEAVERVSVWRVDVEELTGKRRAPKPGQGTRA